MSARTTLRATDPLYHRGDKVEVHEDGLRPWTGVVTYPKWSSESGWWYEVREDFERGGTYAVLEATIVRLEAP